MPIEFLEEKSSSKIEFIDEPNDLQALSTLDKGVLSNATPEQTNFVQNTLSPQELDAITEQQYYSQQLGTNLPPEAVEAIRIEEYGEDSTPQVANQYNERPKQYIDLDALIEAQQPSGFVPQKDTLLDPLKMTWGSIVDSASNAAEGVLDLAIDAMNKRASFDPTTPKSIKTLIEEKQSTEEGKEFLEETKQEFIGDANDFIQKAKPEIIEETQKRVRQKLQDDEYNTVMKAVMLTSENAGNLISSANMAIAGTIMYGNERKSMDDELKAAGLNSDERLPASRLYGVLSGMIEYSENITRRKSAFGKSAGTIKGQILSKAGSAAKNVTEEVLQQVLSNIIYNDAVTKHNEATGDNIALKELPEGVKDSAEGSLLITATLESLGLSVKGIKAGGNVVKKSVAGTKDIQQLDAKQQAFKEENIRRAKERIPYTLGKANLLNKTYDNLQIEEIAGRNLIDSSDQQERLLWIKMVREPNEGTVHAYNEYTFKTKPMEMAEQQVAEFDTKKAEEQQQDQEQPKEEAVKESLTTKDIDNAGIEQISDVAESVIEPQVDRSKAQRLVEKTTRLTTRLGSISPKIRNKVRRMDLSQKQLHNRMNIEVAPLVSSYMETRKKLSKEEKAKLDAEILNLDKEALSNRGITGIEGFQNILKESGVRLGLTETEMMENYFPRKVKDYDKLIKHLGSKPKGIFEKEINAAEKKKGEELNEKEKIAIIDGVLRRTGEGASFKKQRSIDKVTSDIVKYYEDPAVYLQQFISRVSDAIAKREMFGVDSKLNEEFDAQNVDESVSKEINDAIEAGDLAGNIKDQQELADLLKARLSIKGTPKPIQLYSRGVYFKYVTNLKTAIKQFGDLSVSAGENGILNTAKSNKEAKKWASQFNEEAKNFLEELGINTIDAEFKDINKSMLEEMLFKPLQAADIFNKNILAGSTMSRWSSMSEADLAKEMTEYLGDSALGSKIASDITAGKWTEDVAFALYSKMADFHPVSHSEHMKMYIDNPNLRMLFVLKSFAITRWDRLYRESFKKYITGVEKAKNGNVKEGAKDAAEGTIGLARFLIYTVALEVAIDKAWDAAMQALGLRSQPEDEEEQFKRSFTGMYLGEISRVFPWVDGYSFEQAWDREDPFMPFEDIMMPTKPIGFDTATSILKAIKDEDKELKDFNQWKKDIPYIGQEWYKKSKSEE